MSEKAQRAIDALVEGLLNDPLVELVMQADRVSREDAQAVLVEACSSLAAKGDADEQEAASFVFSPVRSVQFRPGVGILLFNKRGDVFIGQRNDVEGEAWQMPQGGVDEGEDPLDAALRELREEIGTDHVEVLAESKGWLRYEWPADVARRLWDGQWRGQQQKWFAMKFLGTDAEIDVSTKHPEFSAWRWATLQQVTSLIVAFKRPVYERLLMLFSEHATID